MRRAAQRAMERWFWLAGSVGVTIYGFVFFLAKSNDDAKNVLHKFNMWIHGIVHLVVTNETGWKPEKVFDDPAKSMGVAKNEGAEVIKKEVIFIRHGESKWNEVFNKGKKITRFFVPGFYIRLLSAMFWETLDAVTGDSVFLDSPLSQEGIDQAHTLSGFLERKEPHENKQVERFRQILLGNQSESIVCSSNLRRALATTTIGLWPRLKKGKDVVHVLSDLQESSRNVDTMALSKPKSIPPLPVTQDALGSGFNPAKVFVTEENAGNKPTREKGHVRLRRFAEWVFSSNSSDVVIAGGHSLYFRNFFRSFLPRASGHPAKKTKIRNGGAVAFTFCKSKVGDQTVYMVEEDSIVEVNLGFDI